MILGKDPRNVNSLYEWQCLWILEFRISETVEEKLSAIDSVVIWDPDELDLIHKTKAVDFVIKRDEFEAAKFDEFQGKINHKLWSIT